MQIFLNLILFLVPLSLSADEPYLENIQQLTFEEMGFEKAGEPYFSPDGNSIIFQAVPIGNEHYQMYTMNLGERIPKMVSTGRGACTCGFFHPNEDKILFASSHEGPECSPESKPKDKYSWEFTPYMNIYEACPDGSCLRALTTGPAYSAECAYSPDGNSIVYTSNKTGTLQIYTMDRDGSNVSCLTSESTCYSGGPFFSPDGTKIIYRADPEKKNYLQIFVMDRDGKNKKALTDNGCVNWAPFWHPCGNVIAFTTSLHGHHRYEIYLMNINTGKQVRLTDHEGFDGLPSFNKAGDKIVWTSKRGAENSCQIFIADFTMPANLME